MNVLYLVGPRGSGKTSIAKRLNADAYVTLQDLRMPFNSGWLTPETRLVVVDDDNVSVKQSIPMIYDEELIIERKGKDPIKIKNTITWIVIETQKLKG